MSSKLDAESETSIDQLVGANVRAELARRQRTQGWLAKQLGITQQSVSQRLGGRVSFDIAELNKISQVLAVALTDLLPEQAA
jgi:transcriptional regulator with XRE-family HTH domain